MPAAPPSRPTSRRPSEPPIAADGVTLGTLDMREWLDTIQTVDELVAETIDAGLYKLQHESLFVVTDTYDNGPECVELVDGWARASRRHSQQNSRPPSRPRPCSKRYGYDYCDARRSNLRLVPSASIAAALAVPALASFLGRDGGDDQGGERVAPPPTD
jgi:hypothetical protein